MKDDTRKEIMTIIENADNGDEEAMLTFIGMASLSSELYSNPFAIKKRNEYIVNLVENGNPAGFILAGDDYLNGDILERSVEKAVAFYYLAANSGETFGYELIAKMHLDGDGLPVNYQLAYEFLKKSEDSNAGQMRSDLGYFFMGEMFYHGLCVAKDWGKAKDYYMEVMKKYYGGDYYMKACERVASMNAL
ncbi:tetratricopeptide repeat protein [Butyrivibrio hungatei]|uniref:Sel1 repeat-containing protein n=1 Tax=Butyrivibrio hungatei TaxID=185008 RepID=A0A1D9P0F0_9FIRM|nr:sel1 repeat family protein [Butyrivibrio hungatei]AOZ95949.1 hypothetical protein bhn_I0915 [Butyrivibrio hungatei]